MIDAEFDKIVWSTNGELRTRFSAVHWLDPNDDKRTLCGRLVGYDARYPKEFRWWRPEFGKRQCKTCRNQVATMVTARVWGLVNKGAQ